MNPKLKNFLEKALEYTKKAAVVIAEFTARYAKKAWRSILKKLDAFAEFMEPKIISALTKAIDYLNLLSQQYEERRIARSKLSPKEKFLRYFPRATVIALILLGLSFIVGVYHLFLTGGDTPFSRERVGSYLIILAIPSAIAVIMLAANAVLAKKFPKSGDDKYEGIAAADFKLKARIKKLNSQFDFDNAPKDIKERIENQRKREKNALTVAITVTAITVIYSAAVVFNTARYTIENVNSDIAGAMLPTLLCTAITLGVWSAWSVIRTKARQEVVFAIKDATRANKALYLKTERKEHSVSFIHSDTAKNILRALLITASAVLILLGILNGGMADVLAKAVKICTECIGLG